MADPKEIIILEQKPKSPETAVARGWYEEIPLLLFMDEVSIYRFGADFDVAAVKDVFKLKFYSITKTSDETSIIIPSKDKVFAEISSQSFRVEPGFMVFKINCVMDFGIVGIIAPICKILKNHFIPVFVLSTFNTDYILIKHDYVDRACSLINQLENYKVNRLLESMW